MKILQVHNKYIYSGGEDIVANQEKTLLEGKGHSVIQYQRDNNEIIKYSINDMIRLFYETVWSKRTFREIFCLITELQPDICHVHNFFPLISPAVFQCCQDMSVPVVLTLHNFRLLCSNSYFYRNVAICEECLGGSLYHSLRYKCYHDSRVQTWALARMVEKHKNRGTWTQKIDAYICLTEFQKVRFIQGGFPPEKLSVKPNTVTDQKPRVRSVKDFFIFAGRLDSVKGIQVLIRASEMTPGISFQVAGIGPLQEWISRRVSQNTVLLGQLDRKALFQKLSDSTGLIYPSLWYETFGLTLVEAFSCSTPVIASRLGAMSELVEDGRTGLLFNPGDAEDLAQKIRWAHTHPREMRQMGRNARLEYEKKYTPERNYRTLMKIYQKAMENHRQKERRD